MNSTARTVIVDDQPLLLQALANFFDTSPGIEVVGTAGNGQEAVEKVAQLKPDVVVMDLDMPVMDGIEATRRITSLSPRPHILVLTQVLAESWVLPALQAGADGFLLKDSEPEVVLQSLEDLMNSSSPLLAPEVQKLAEEQRDPKPWEALSSRELDVLHALAGGLTNRQISERLFLAEPTVKSYLTYAAQKLNVSGRVQLLLKCVNLGLVRIGGTIEEPSTGE